MQAGLYPSAQNMPGSKPSTGGRFNSRARSRPNHLNQSVQQMMRGTHFVPSNVYGSVSSVNETPPQKTRAKFPATSTHFMPASQHQLNQSSPLAPLVDRNNHGASSRSNSRQRHHHPQQQLPASTGYKSRQPGGHNKFVPLLSDTMDSGDNQTSD